MDRAYTLERLETERENALLGVRNAIARIQDAARDLSTAFEGDRSLAAARRELHTWLENLDGWEMIHTAYGMAHSLVTREDEDEGELGSEDEALVARAVGSAAREAAAARVHHAEDGNLCACLGGRKAHEGGLGFALPSRGYCTGMDPRMTEKEWAAESARRAEEARH